MRKFLEKDENTVDGKILYTEMENRQYLKLRNGKFYYITRNYYIID